MDWAKLLELAPLALMKPGSPEGAAMLAGYQQSMQRMQQQQMQQHGQQRQDQLAHAQMGNLQADNQRAEQQLEMQRQRDALARVSAYRNESQGMLGSLAEKPETFLPPETDPLQAQNNLTVSRLTAQQDYGVPADMPQGPLPNMTALVSEAKKRRAKALYEQAEKTFGAEAMAGDSITLKTGEFGDVKPSALRALFSLPAVNAQGLPASPPLPKRPRALQSKEMLVKGQPTIVQFDPETGEYFDQGMAPVKVAPIPPAPPAPREPRNERLVQIEGADGKAVWTREGDAVGKPAAQAARAITGQERQTLAFFNRAKEAGELADQLEERVASAGLGSQLQQEYGGNLLQTKDQQRYRQAQRAFTEARLRKESGAAIPVAEYTNDARTYFAQPGDSPETRAQKRQARSTVLEGLKFSSGRAYEEFYGEVPTRGGAKPAAGGTVEFDYVPGKGLVPRKAR